MRAVAAMFSASALGGHVSGRPPAWSCSASGPRQLTDVSGLSRAVSDADDLHGGRADAIADDVGRHGHKLAYVASRRSSAMWKDRETLHRLSETGDGGFRRDGRALGLDVAPNGVEFAKGGSCKPYGIDGCGRQIRRRAQSPISGGGSSVSVNQERIQRTTASPLTVRPASMSASPSASAAASASASKSSNREGSGWPMPHHNTPR